LSRVVNVFVGSWIGTRVVIAIGMIAPLGFCLGAFMPIGLRCVAAVTDHKVEFIAWAWAVNGFFSALNSILSTIIAMSYGFRVVLIIALVVYCVGVAMMMRIPDRQAS